MAALFGIHVGNSSACLAIYKDEDRVDVVANDAGERVTPAIVQWTPTNCIVGRAAQLEQFRNTTSTVIRNKQLLNENISQAEFDGLKSKIVYRINKTDTNVKYELLIEGKQYHVSPKEIINYIFKKVHNTAEAAVGGNKEMNAVLCVPLYYSSKSVELVKDVATRAGFKILQIIDEPCAAALGYNLAVEPEELPSYCLVYRVGGVSIDATILLIQDGMFSVLGSVHKHNLGGSSFTEKLSEFLASEFKRQFKTTDITERGKYKLLAAAENVKQILSIQNVAQCSVESIGGGFDLNCSVSRARFENIMLPFIPEMLAPITEVLNQTGLSVDKINKVIGCGGSLKIPKLKDSICNLFPSAEALINIAPDELISLGAAKQASYCIKYESLPESLAIDTPALTHGLLLTERQENVNEEKSHLILKNSSIPMRRRYNVSNVEKSLSVDVDIPEKNNLSLGSVSLDDLEPNSTVTIELDINKDGKLLLHLINEASGRKNCLKYDLNDVPTS